MASCCSPNEFDRTFDTRFARRMATRYRKRGLDKTARRMVDHLAKQGVRDTTVLEIGGGVGEIQLELLKRGAAHATNLELSPAYDAEAQQLLTEAGLSDRAERRMVDIAAEPAAVEPADIVVLHRVVCCYPDFTTLLSAVAEHARQQVVFSYPPRNPLSRLVVATQNMSFRLRGSNFRVFVHPPQAMTAVLTAHGLRSTYTHSGPMWRVVGASR